MARTVWQRAGSLFPHFLAWTAITAVAQTVAAPVVNLFHPVGPLVSYDVATIKPATATSVHGQTIRRYIMSAYGVGIPMVTMGTGSSQPQVVGGPAWIDTDRYEIVGKPPDELREAMQKMTSHDRTAQTMTMEQSLLAERFHLKVHFEARMMPVFELVPAKSGLKIKAVDPPPAPRWYASARTA